MEPQFGDILSSNDLSTNYYSNQHQYSEQNCESLIRELRKIITQQQKQIKHLEIEINKYKDRVNQHLREINDDRNKQQLRGGSQLSKKIIETLKEENAELKDSIEKLKSNIRYEHTQHKDSRLEQKFVENFVENFYQERLEKLERENKGIVIDLEKTKLEQSQILRAYQQSIIASERLQKNLLSQIVELKKSQKRVIHGP